MIGMASGEETRGACLYETLKHAESGKGKSDVGARDGGGTLGGCLR